MCSSHVKRCFQISTEDKCHSGSALATSSSTAEASEAASLPGGSKWAQTSALLHVLMINLCKQLLPEILRVRGTFRPDFTSKLVPELAFVTPKFYIAPYDKIKHELVKLSSNRDVKSGLNIQL